MNFNKKAVAEKLLHVKAVQLNVQQPFTWASGIKSPIYCDNRTLLSFPHEREFVKSELCNIIFEQFEQADVVAGVATAGIPWATMAADQLKLPLVYVRSKAKEHGLGRLIEGSYKEGQRVVVVEDLVSTGNSALSIIDILKAASLQVIGLVSIFNYQFEEADQLWANHGIPYTALTDYSTTVEVAVQQKYISEHVQDSLMLWRQNPKSWANTL